VSRRQSHDDYQALQKENTMKVRAIRFPILSGALAGLALALCCVAPARADLTPAVQAKVDSYKAKLVEWAAHPAIVAAVRESNSKGGLVPGMTNAKWDELADGDPIVKGFQASAAGKLVSKWEEDKALDKLFVRDEKGNLVASSVKPLLYNNANRPPFKNGLAGAWNAGAVKPDPTTQKQTVQVSVPVVDGGKNIGVLQTAIVAE
jgi:hypothetical protein